MTALFAGFFTALSLIAAIGAQNAFVLRQGLRREHVLFVVLACALSDALLIAAGVAGFGTLATLAPWITTAMLYAGAAFLIVYGALRFKAALRGGEALRPAHGTVVSLGRTLTTVLVLTWANPHVYLDTVVLLGAISAQYAPQHWIFATGAIAGSFAFFTALGFGARLLAPLFANPRAWVWLEMIVGLTMWIIAAALIFGA
ncbi:MAG: LysE/ArgO family amino acid transporter [Pseudotabrizicola sp.]|uniref:LysE/ArgO family amino acid transporter n=1 Tax=Pseudotabrizicola sp. TaxID=2939647 RepID=UPI00272F2076|nr:LysE/ArgO family amino acid transporter [Pseudotabrizicola sp.]MDP2080631.1 LysE/ArgO family amino acid transporter [Pseudotabrizicola sp.]MDZ7573360.1 LysE/ArgO family amino acid transporter [Pseudotabrizicola sp.]